MNDWVGPSSAKSVSIARYSGPADAGPHCQAYGVAPRGFVGVWRNPLIPRFGVGEADVSEILKAETDRVSDGAEMRAEWMLASRRLRDVEIKFHNKAVADMDCQAAVV